MNKQDQKSEIIEKAKIGMKMKLLGVLLPLVMCVILAIVLLVYFDTRTILLTKSEDLLSASTESVTNSVKAWMNETITALEIERDTMQYYNMDEAQIKEYVAHTANRYDSFPAGIYVATTEGQLIHTSFVPGADYNLYEKPWYIDGLESEQFLFGSVYFDQDSQSYVVGASGMLKDQNGKVRGVAAADIYMNAISEIVKQVQLEQTGGAFIVDAITGTIIGHKNQDMIGTKLIEQTDPIYEDILNKIEQKGTGIGVLRKQDGSRLYVDIQPVQGSEWMTVAYVPQTEILAGLTRLTKVAASIAAVGCILLVILMERIIHLTVKPVRKMSKVMAAMTDGDFTVEIHVKTSDEIGVMANGIRRFIETMRDTIQQIDHVSETLNGQSHESTGIAEGLSESSSLQAQSMSEMNRTITELTDSITNVAENATSLSHLVMDTSEAGKNAGEQMKKAVAASDSGMTDMKNISAAMQGISEKMDVLEISTVQMDSSIDKINSIVELIREIAEETNLLSLNASIEAARAGESGRGFAVVADQIGKLASTSKEAVDDIAKLTGEIHNIVGKTVQETKESAQAIKNSRYVVKETEETFNQIYHTVERSNAAMEQMISRINEVNDIATNLAGITEEQSAASEEILATTETMHENAEKVSEESVLVAQGAESLGESAELLKKHMNRFKV